MINRPDGNGHNIVDDCVGTFEIQRYLVPVMKYKPDI